MALGLDGDALDCSCPAGSRQRLPTIEGAQTAASATCRSGSTSNEKVNQPCSPNQSRITSTMATTASQCSTNSGTSPIQIVKAPTGTIYDVELERSVGFCAGIRQTQTEERNKSFDRFSGQVLHPVV